jgi:hypothetical protein
MKQTGWIALPLVPPSPSQPVAKETTGELNALQ